MAKKSVRKCEMMKKTLFFCLCLFVPWQVFGQFSPGKLSRYHAELEGTSNCIQCHDIGKKEVSDGCQKCHTPLLKRIKEKTGYHADKADGCKDCHSDHNGREFELVYWPKNIKNFNHNETGYTLSGKHRDAKCRDCHQPKYIQDKELIKWAGEHPQFNIMDRTFLGLGTECLTCHEDVHRDEVSDDCTKCHNTFDWKKAADEFDHNQARFLLTGAHEKVKCGKCHKIPDNTKKVWQLTGMAFDQCGRCHDDVHKGSFGSTCERCHTTVDWKKNQKRFDHNSTKYPLVGKHVNVACQDCHTPQLQGTLPKFDLCSRCHADEHDGQFLTRAEGGECSQCHTVYAFKPTTFTMSMHQAIRFTLEGAHRAVPCIACHKPYMKKDGNTTVRFTWTNLQCTTCHKDEHRNQFQAHFNNSCDKCHTVITFSQINFDHQATTFPLDGKHQNVPCEKCHFKETDSVGEYIRYYPVAHRCVDCHSITDQIQ